MVSTTGSSSPYKALSTGGKEIRLLEILPSRCHFSTIRGALSTVSTRDEPQYETLSYTWGASTKGASICIDRRYRIPVTDNLLLALRRLRHPSEPRTIWIDAICINQTDLQERSEQVAIMGEIYASARSVNVWLGEVNYVGVLMTLLFQYAWYRILYDSLRKLVHFSWPMYYRASAALVSSWPQAMDAAICNTVPMWSERAWVVQEFILSHRAHICFGRFRVPWKFDHFGEVDRLARQLDVTLPHYAAFMHRMATVDLLRAETGNRDLYRRQSPSNILRLVSGSKATDSRDMVYSLLSLLDPEENVLITPDYTNSCAEVYARATYASIERHHGSLEILFRKTFRSRAVEDLPTWAVDYRNVNSKHTPSDAWRTSIGSQAFTESAAIMSADSKTLTLNGVMVASIAALVGDLTHQQDFWIAANGDGEEHAAEKAEARALELEVVKVFEWAVATFLLQTGSVREPTDLVAQPRDESRVAAACLSILSGHRSILLRSTFEKWDQMTAISPDSDHTSLTTYLDHAQAAAGSVAFFATDCGHIGVAPNTLWIGDQLFLAYGSDYPIIVRRRSDDRFTFHGMAYMIGMSGEMLEHHRANSRAKCGKVVLW